MSSPRVLLLIPSLASVGGTERMVQAISGLLRDAGCEVHQASFDAPGIPRHFKIDGPCHSLGPIPRLPLFLRPVTYGLAAYRLSAMKRRVKIDVTISNLWGADLISILSRGRDRKIALCHINIVGNKGNRLMLRWLPLVAYVYRCFDKVIAVSGTLAAEVRDLYRLAPRRVGHIDNFTDPSDSRPLWSPTEGSLRFVWCGRFSHEKNVEGLLAAWARFAEACPSAQLILVGDGPDFERMLKLALELGLDSGGIDRLEGAQVVFAGRQADPAVFMASARALLLSSHSEGLPMVVLEALSLGVPVLASDCPSGGVRTALSGHGECEPQRSEAENAIAGLLLPVPDPDDSHTLRIWASALELVARDDARRAAWSGGALERARLFGRAAARDRWAAVLSEVGVRA